MEIASASTSDSHNAALDWMLVLAMTTSCPDMIPSIAFDKPDHITYFQFATTSSIGAQTRPRDSTFVHSYSASLKSSPAAFECSPAFNNNYTRMYRSTARRIRVH